MWFGYAYFVLVFLIQWYAIEATEDVDKDVVGNKNIVETVNKAHTTWRASLKSKFIKSDEESLGAHTGLIPDPKRMQHDKDAIHAWEKHAREHGLGDSDGSSHKVAPLEDNDEDVSLPRNFDARKRWPKCKSIGMIRDQGPCGGCWAISVAQVATDRYCIQMHQKANPILSYRQMLTCSGSGTCHGGREDGSWDYLIHAGLVTGGQKDDTDTCQPSPFALCDHHQMGNFKLCPPAKDTPNCVQHCLGKKSHSNFKRDRFHAARYWDVYGENALKKEVYKRGPVSIAMRVNKDFYFYSEGVYQHITGPFIGFHAVRLIGWGEENFGGKTIPYWIITNTWNSDWGEEGVIRIKRGNGYLGITSGLAGEMKLPEFGVAVSFDNASSSWSTWPVWFLLVISFVFCS